jgi:outer membrane immunogenic protein
MKKNILVCFLLCVAGITGQAQNQEDHFNAGVGLDGRGIPIYGSYDWGLTGDFNLGVGLSLATGGNDIDGGILGAGFFSQWYGDRVLGLPDEFDAYGGLGLYYYNYKGGDDIDLGLFIGGRYYVNDAIGVNLEFGGGTAIAGGKVGISWRL